MFFFDDYDKPSDVLSDKGITKLYHFTDISNVESILSDSGLSSWWACEQKGLSIPKPGGSAESRNLDSQRDLEDYVRLAFTRYHPMMFTAKVDHRIPHPVILEIAKDAVDIDGTLFSDRNAATMRKGHKAKIDGGVKGAKRIHYDLFIHDYEKKYFQIIESKEDNKCFYQAEVLIRTHLPLNYILRISEIDGTLCSSLNKKLAEAQREEKEREERLKARLADLRNIIDGESTFGIVTDDGVATETEAVMGEQAVILSWDISPDANFTIDGIGDQQFLRHRDTCTIYPTGDSTYTLTIFPPNGAVHITRQARVTVITPAERDRRLHEAERQRMIDDTTFRIDSGGENRSDNSTDIHLGQATPVTLGWKTWGAERIEISNEGETTIVDAASGTMTVEPDKSATYTLTVTPTNGTAPFRKSVKVEAYPDAEVLEFRSIYQYVVAGTKSTILWKTKNAEETEVTPPSGYKMWNSEGVMHEPINGDSEFTIKVTDHWGEHFKSLTVRAIPAPIIHRVNIPEVTIRASLNVTIRRPRIRAANKLPKTQARFPRIKEEASRIHNIHLDDLPEVPTKSLWEDLADVLRRHIISPRRFFDKAREASVKENTENQEPTKD